MQVTKLHLVYFSPAGTTKKTIYSIARAMNMKNIQEHDLSKHEIREKTLVFNENDLVLLAMPVYYGRIPSLFHNLNNLKGNNTPAVYIAVYGNREYEDGLLELKDIGEKSGFKSIAAAAFVGEHSLNNKIATGRPDADDEQEQIVFGKKIMEKINSLGAINEINDLNVKGSYPYRPFNSVHFEIDVNDRCISCGTCAEGCPLQVIDRHTFKITDHNKCIFCFRCVKYCPVNARGIINHQRAGFEEKMKQLAKACSQRKKGEIFI